MANKEKWRSVHIDGVAYRYIISGDCVNINFRGQSHTVDRYTLNGLDPVRDFDPDMGPAMNPAAIKEYIERNLL